MDLTLAETGRVCPGREEGSPPGAGAPQTPGKDPESRGSQGGRGHSGTVQGSCKPGLGDLPPNPCGFHPRARYGVGERSLGRKSKGTGAWEGP